MFERNILIVDDNPKIEPVYIPAYQSKIDDLKSESKKWSQYSFNLFHKTSMKDALLYLSNKNNYIDVLVVDYNFEGETTFSSGTAFVKHIRESVNRYCQVVFYTMQGIDSIDKEELVDLINSDVYKIVDKSDDYSEMAQILFEAATQRNPIVESLEHFFLNYGTMLQSYHYTFAERTISFEDIVNHIRMDDDLGRVFIEKLLQKAILLNTDIEA